MNLMNTIISNLILYKIEKSKKNIEILLLKIDFNFPKLKFSIIN